MRPPRAVTKQRNRKRQQLRRDMVHAAGDTYDNCALTELLTVGLFGFDWRADYLDVHSRPVSVPRSLRRIHGSTISPLPIVAEPASLSQSAGSVVSPLVVES